MGGGKDDTLFGGEGDDRLWGDAIQKNDLSLNYQGDDYLDGEEGDDRLVGGGRNDMLYGGTGNDTLLGDDVQENLEATGHGDDYLDGQAGNDQLAGYGGADTLVGGSGDDYLDGDAAETELAAFFDGDDYLDGEDGNDILFGRGGNDALYGGIGNDSLYGGAGSDTLDGGEGNNVLDGGDGNDVLIGSGDQSVLLGGAGSDVLVAGAMTNVLDGGAGDDSYEIDLSTGSASAIVDVDGNNSVLLTGVHLGDLQVWEVGSVQGAGGNPSTPGYLAIASAAGSLQIRVSAPGQLAGSVQFGDGETLTASQLKDAAESHQVIGSSAADTFYGGSQGVLYTTGESADTVDAGGGDDVVYGDVGNDRLLGGTGNDQVDGAVGDDSLQGDGGSDLLLGGEGRDTLVGSTGNDTLYGGTDDDVYVMALGDGEDLLFDSAGTDEIRFGSGLDLASLEVVLVPDTSDLRLAFSSGDSITIRAGQAGIVENYRFADGTVLTYDQLRNLNHSSGGLAPVGSDASDALLGGSGNDTLRAYAGDDTLIGGVGGDMLFGGAGNDVYAFNVGDGQDIIVDEEGASNALRFGGGISAASLTASVETSSDGQQYLIVGYGGAGDEIRIQGGLNAPVSRLLFADGTQLNFGDWLSVALAAVPEQVGTAGADQLFGLANADSLDGLEGNDVIRAGAGDDTLQGGAGADTLFGQAGNDVLDGGSDSDLLQGGIGQDTYIFSPGSGHDTVVDTEGSSLIQLGAGASLDQLVLDRSGQDLVMRFEGGAGASLTVRGYFDAPSLWSVASDGEAAVALTDLYSQLQDQRAQMSDEQQAALAMADFAERLEQDRLLRTMGEGFTRDSDGTYRYSRPSATNSNVTESFLVSLDVRETMTNAAWLQLTSDGLQQTEDWIETGSRTRTESRRVTDTVVTSASPIRFIPLDRFGQMFGGQSFDPSEYVATYGQDDQGNNTLLGYMQMAPGTAQQVGIGWRPKRSPCRYGNGGLALICTPTG
ncbi:MAG TPA: calcium-binding protein [Albitalea sp.]